MKFEIVTEKDLPLLRQTLPSPYSELKERLRTLALGEILKVHPEGVNMRNMKTNLPNWGSQMNLRIRYRTGADGCVYIWKEHFAEGKK